MSPIRDVIDEGWCVRLDLSAQRLRIDVPEHEHDISAWQADEAPLVPVLSLKPGDTVSASALLLKAKQFDDGLYAAVELAAQDGCGRFRGKATLLRSLVSKLADSPSVGAFVLAACRLGEIETPAASEQHVRAKEIVAKFRSNPLLSKPLGFYTWSPKLDSIFRQDRLLQQPLLSPDADTILRTLHASQGLFEAYEAWLQLNERLTNPSARTDLRDSEPNRSFAPASRSHEQVLFERLYGNRPVPANYDLMSDLISRIRAGEIDLAPMENSGWYDHQSWSLVPLVIPDRMEEASRVEYGKGYRDHLEEVFRAALALTRETHVKQVAVALGGAGMDRTPTIYVTPQLSVEPLPTLYARRALTYRFVKTVLLAAFGEEGFLSMKRISQEGPFAKNLLSELEEMENLFEGASAAARQELGMDASLTQPASTEVFRNWQKSIDGDADLSRDARMMVPVFYDVERNLTKVWAFLGWRWISEQVSFIQNPTIMPLDLAKTAEPEPLDRLSQLRRKFQKPPESDPVTPRIRFRGSRVRLAQPVFVETYVTTLLDRDEFRRHCDKFVTREAIVANLK
jgi:hypothetical protein